LTDGNGQNDWGVGFSLIMWLDGVLRTHKNVASVRRYNDIVFEVLRVDPSDVIHVLCINKYSASLEVVMSALEDFPETGIIFYGGKWNGATGDAAAYCEERQVGLYNAGEISTALRNSEYWKLYPAPKPPPATRRSA
jgi:hypothetical protein